MSRWNEKVVLTIVHEKAGRAQLYSHRVIGPSGRLVIEKPWAAPANHSLRSAKDETAGFCFSITRWPITGSPDRFADVF
jgi:hypothetical protein